MTSLLPRIALALLFGLVLGLPAWWVAGRLACRASSRDAGPSASPFFRLLVAVGAALVGFLGAVNLIGRALEDSLAATWIWFGLNAALAAWILVRRRDELSIAALASSWRAWTPVVLLALVVGAPQWWMAVSTPYWDEVASSSIHLTAPQQFAEGVFPPRHGAFPDLPVKYHYATTMLSGELIALTGLSANVCIDLVSTALHLFVFLFVFHWLRQLAFRRVACAWGAFAVLFAGGLAWLYVPRLESYAGFPKHGDPSQLEHGYDAAQGWWGNLMDAARAAVFHLRNADGGNSNLPWEVVNQFQQHAVALGIALTVFAAWVFCTWIGRERFSLAWFLAATFTFGLLLLGHAVLGSVACATAGLVLVGRWFARPSVARLLEAVAFVALVATLALAHGGVLSRGEGYGVDFTTLTLRRGLGYSEGGLRGFVDWNLAGFGLPLLLSALAGVLWIRRRATAASPRRIVFAFFAVMLLVSYLPPQFLYYSYGGSSIEEHTEIAKFFFATHLALGVLSAFALVLALPARPVYAWLAAPAFAAAAVVPVFCVVAATFDANGRWLGFYASPYSTPGSADEARMGRAFARAKHGPRDVYYDASGHDAARDAYVDELQLFGGSAFSLTARRYERTGSFLIDRTLVAERSRLNSRMARLRPGAEEESGTSWIYARPEIDFARLPLLVRCRFDKLRAEGVLVLAASSGPRALYDIVGSTASADEGLERWWRPRVVAQTRAPRADGRALVPVFYDRRRQELVSGGQRSALPRELADDFVHVQAGRFQPRVGAGTAPDFVAARMADAHYWRGAQVMDIDDHRSWCWSYRDPESGAWSPERPSWFWDLDVPLFADLDGDGAQEGLAWRLTTGEWFRGNQAVPGPGIAPGAPALPLAVPVVGKFLAGAAPCLALFSPGNGAWSLLPFGAEPGKPAVAFQFGAPDDVLVPGDYDGDDVDEIVVWRRSNRTWYRRDPATGAAQPIVFGSATGVPLPCDYDGDGALDLAYWEPAEHVIRVSFTRGSSTDLLIAVPPDSLPVFVSTY